MAVQRQSEMRWNNKDFIKLEKAINSFNYQVKKLTDEENKLFIPDRVNFKEIRSMIDSRKQFNSIINELNRFNETTAEKVTLDSGEEITKWEYQNLKRRRRIAEKRIELELQEKELEEEQKQFGMPSEHVQLLRSQLKGLRSLETKTGTGFERTKSQILRLGREDYELWRAKIYQANFLDTVKEKYSNLKGYDRLMAVLNSKKNPVDFYNLVHNNGDEFMTDLTYQSNQGLSEEDFMNWVTILENVAN